MKKQLIIIGVTLTLLSVGLSGCTEQKDTTNSNSNLLNGNQTNTPKIPENPDLSLNLLPCWWISTWSENGLSLDVSFSKGNNSLHRSNHIENRYNPYSELIENIEITNRSGEDILGRLQNITIIYNSGYTGGSVKPNAIVGYGTFMFPNGTSFDQSKFTRSFNTTITYEYNEKGQLKGGTGNEEFYGHILTSTGKISYSGSLNGTFITSHDLLAWTKLVEKTNYYYEGKLYANTDVVILPQSKLDGTLHIIREDINTTTTYFDNSQRVSEIVILWQRDDFGVCIGKSGSGFNTGTEIINEKPVQYTGTINITYDFDNKTGYYRINYYEERSAETGLLKRLPFEAIFIDDLDLMPVFFDI